MSKSVSDIINAVDQNAMLVRPLADWHNVLAADCQVYQLDNGGFLAKNFSQINYKFCDADTAKQVLIDNLFSILKNKYFPLTSDETLERTSKIVSSMTQNLRSVLKTLTFNKHNVLNNSNLHYAQNLPDGCIAFRNGVYDFRNANWLFKYEKLHLSTGLNLISYTNDYVINWYMNFDFDPLDFKLTDVSLDNFIELLKDIDKTQPNLCFELIYNICHTRDHAFDIKRFEHLCQVLGYVCLNSFAQYFVMLIGAGQNGKNSLFDGCFTEHVVPKPSSISLDDIENDRFVTGALQEKAHNIFLETSAKTYRESKTLKALTGSQDQTIEHKNVSKYSGIINCKFVFAGNNRNEIKFADTTQGFLRRINMFEIFYTWDKYKSFLDDGDYFDTTFSGDLHELKNDISCAIIFVYLAMYGIKSCTDNFNKSFDFTHNEWSSDFADVDHELKSSIDKLRLTDLLDWVRSDEDNMNELRTGLYSPNKKQLWQTFVDDDNEQIFKNFDAFIYSEKTVKTEEGDTSYYNADDYITSAKDMFISVSLIKNYIEDKSHARAFTLALQRLYGTNCFTKMGANISVIHCTFKKGKLYIIK